MQKAVYIVLGSNYDVNLEYKMKFIQELIANQYSIDIFSVDMKPIPVNPPDISDVNLIRMSLKLKNETINQFINEIQSIETTIDLLIVLDSMDFKGPIFGNQIVDRILSAYPNIPSYTFFHFITPNFENPVFNGQSISNFNFDNFSLMPDAIPELTEYVTNQKKLEAIDKQIAKQSDRWYQLQNFMDSPGFKMLFSNPAKARNIILEAITKHICQQISLDNIGLQNKLNSNVSFQKKS